MKLHEYQAKELLADYGVPVPRGRVARTPEEAHIAAGELGGKVVVKAQAHTGGRGKGGGVILAGTAEEARDAAREILGMQLVTHQTGPAGLPVHTVLVEEQIDIARELYLSIAIDNSAGKPVVIASAEGGMDIEAVAESNPDAIHNQLVYPYSGFQPFQGRALAFATGLDGDLLRPATDVMTNLVRAFEENDGAIAEINPLVVTGDGKLLAADAKFSTDDTPTTGTSASPSCATPRKRTPARSRRKRRASRITSSWTGTSAVWSTARASRWRRWMRSISRAASRPTSSTSAPRTARTRW